MFNSSSSAREPPVMAVIRGLSQLTPSYGGWHAQGAVAPMSPERHVPTEAEPPQDGHGEHVDPQNPLWH
jgi:hypothetical protein